MKNQIFFLMSLVFGLSANISTAKAEGPILPCSMPNEAIRCTVIEQTKENTLIKMLKFAIYDEVLKSGVQIRDGEKILTEIPCFKQGQKVSPDKPMPIYQCYNPTLVDSGYSVILENADFAGRQFATVSEITIAGAREIAKLSCTKDSL